MNTSKVENHKSLENNNSIRDIIHVTRNASDIDRKAKGLHIYYGVMPEATDNEVSMIKNALVELWERSYQESIPGVIAGFKRGDLTPYLSNIHKSIKLFGTKLYLDQIYACNINPLYYTPHNERTYAWGTRFWIDGQPYESHPYKESARSLNVDLIKSFNIAMHL